MQRHRSAALLTSVYASFLLTSVHALANDVFANPSEQSQVALKFGALRITDVAVELRCKIMNDTEQDIWVYALGVDERTSPDAHAKNAGLFLDSDSRTIIVFRRMNMPYRGEVHAALTTISYVRVAAGQSRPELFRIKLPVVLSWPLGLDGIHEAIARGIEKVTQLVFEIGYFSTDDLDSYRGDPMIAYRPRFNESGDKVMVAGFVGDKARWGKERAVRITINGLSIPYKDWLVFKEESGVSSDCDAVLWALPRILSGSRESLTVQEFLYVQQLFRFDGDMFDGASRRIADVFRELMKGDVEPGDLARRLDAVLPLNDRLRLADELLKRRSAGIRGSHIDVLERLFYSFSLDLENYQYARELLAIDTNLLGDTSQQIADIYIELAEGRLSPTELPYRLDKVCSRSDREKLLRQFQRRETHDKRDFRGPP